MNNYSLQNYVVELLGWSEESVNSLNQDHKKWVVVLIGPPGSGKGTQADLLSEKFGLFHLESSKVIEEKIKNGDPDDPILQREKKLWETGILNTPELVLQWIQEKVRELAVGESGIVLSGSPRTLPEAEGEVPLFEELYGKDNIKVFNINISEEESVKRNSKRRICKKSRHPIPNFPEFDGITECPRDGGEIVTRLLDNPETIRVRYQEYLNRTLPIIDFLKKISYEIVEIDGKQTIENVFKDILKNL